MSVRVLCVILLGLASGCVSRRVAARELIEARRLPEALSLWERRLAEEPADPEAVAGRREVLVLQARYSLLVARNNFEAHELTDALRSLAEEDRLQTLAGVALPDAEKLRTEIDAQLRERLESSIGLGQLLVAKAELDALQHTLPSPEMTALRATLTEASTSRCLELRGLASTSYLAAATWRYCSKLGVNVARPPVAPEARASIHVDQAVTPTDAAEPLTEAVIIAFAGSPWIDSRATGSVESRVAGAVESRAEATPLELTASWQETESYQESHTETEYYTETYYESETYTYGCYSGSVYTTCTGTRLVPRTRQASRQVTKTETKYRPVTRSVTYPATQRKAWHRANLEVALALPGLAKAVTVSLNDSADQEGIEHAMDVAAAKLKPQRGVVQTSEQWVEKQRVALLAKLRPAVRDAWEAAYCREPMTLETAAKCLAGARSEAPAARLALVRFFGEPSELVDTFARVTP